jgi:site-specific recombinase XerD
MTQDTDVLERREVEAMLGAINTRYATGARNHALLSFMLATGLRVSEALAVEWADIAEETWEHQGRRVKLHVLHVRAETTKGRRPRAPIPLNEATVLSLERWRRHRSRLRIGKGPLFCTLTRGAATGFGERALKAGRPLSRQYVWAMLRRVAERAGIVRRVHPHMTRHTCGTRLYEQGHDLKLAQERLGHSSLRHTERYAHVHPWQQAVAEGLVDATEGDEGGLAR